MKIKSYFYDQQINKKKLSPSIETKTGNPWFTFLSLLIKIWQVLVFNISFVNSLNTWNKNQAC